MPLLETIAKEAQLTFSGSISDEDFSESLDKLLSSVNRIRVADLKLKCDAGQNADGTNAADLKLKCDAGQNANGTCAAKPSPSIINVLIAENRTFSMGIFILNSGSCIPLHDHPGMYGILKVIKGTIKITSYSALPNVPSDSKIPQDVINRVKRAERDSLIPVQKHNLRNVTVHDKPCVLRPKEGNYHEISAVGGKAAFFDILAPPYDYKERDCHYYIALETNKSDSEVKTWLLRTSPPSYSLFGSARYTGPKISL